MLAYHSKSFGITCPPGVKCVLKTTARNKFTVMSWALVGWGVGNTAKVDKFTMCLEQFNGEDTRRVSVLITEEKVDRSCIITRIRQGVLKLSFIGVMEDRCLSTGRYGSK